MSKIYLECLVKQADPKLASLNLNNTLKCPINWVISELSELTNRYSQDITENNEWNTFLRYQESIKIPIKTQSQFKGTKKPSTRIKVKINSVNSNADIIVRSSALSSETINIPTNIPVWIESELGVNSTYIQVYQLDSDNTFNIYEGVTVSYKTSEIDLINEFVNYNIVTNLKDDITIGNTVHQRKIGKTITSFTNDLIISPTENYELLDVLGFARINRKLTYVWIQDSGTSGETLANLPQDSGFIRYYYINHISSQTTGIYENISISYQHDPANGVY